MYREDRVGLSRVGGLQNKFKARELRTGKNGTEMINHGI